MNLLLGMLLSYLTGSIPMAYIFGKRLKGIDIRQHGSGNMGATNVFRVLGKGPGIAVLCLDIIKGILPVAVLGNFLGLDKNWQLIALGIAAVCGHNWTVFLQFKGGKGIATSFGVLIGLTVEIAVLRPVLLATVLAWAIVFLSTGYVSLASMIAAVLLPVVMILTNQSFATICLGIVFCILVILRHRSNIKRLLAGEENRVPLSYLKKKSS